MALNGADIILHQTQGWGIACNVMGEALVRTRAAENSVYMVVAKNIQHGDGGKSCIINNYGNILIEAPGDEEKVITAEFEPNFDMVHEDHFNSLFSGVDSVRARLALERLPSLYTVITSERAPLLERYKGVELKTTPDKVPGVFKVWKEYLNAVRNHRQVKTKYHR